MLKSFLKDRSNQLLLIKVACLLALILATNMQLLDGLKVYFNEGRFFQLWYLIILWGCALASLFLLSIYRLPLIIRILWASSIALSTLGADLHLILMGEHLNIDTFDMVLFTEFAPSENLFFFEVYKEKLILPLLKTLILFVLLLTKPFKGTPPLKFLSIAPLVPILMILFVFYRTGGSGVMGLPAQFSSLAVAATVLIDPPVALDRASVQLSMNNEKTFKNIIVIVDESIRSDFLSVNSHHNTTPYLLKAQGLINFGRAIAGNNCSGASNALLRMGAHPSQLGNRQNSIMHNPSVWQYAQRAGYETNYIDGQMNEGRFSDFFTPLELSFIDYKKQISHPNFYQKDLVAISEIKQILARDKPQFIYLNKYGAHFHYEGAYPDSHRKFKPTLERGEPIKDKQKLLNSYKNAVYWSVDHFFETLLKEIQLDDQTLIIYTSDHGQNLLDDGQPITHCRVNNPTPEEALVPLLLFTKNQNWLQRFKKGAQLNWNHATHLQIFPTLLVLFGYDHKEVTDKYYLTLLENNTEVLKFSSGAIFGRMGREATWNPVS